MRGLHSYIIMQPKPEKNPGLNQSRTQSPQALWTAVSLQERLWEHRILLLQDFCGKTMETITEQPIKKMGIFSMSPESLLAPTR